MKPDISQKLLNTDIYQLINKDLINYYLTPGKIYYLIRFFNENKIDLTKYNLNSFINLIISENYYKKDQSIKSILYEFIEFFLLKKFL